MNPTNVINAFLSHSYDPADKEVIEYISNICTGLGFNCYSVDVASPSTPPGEARKLISESQGLIAICSRRDRIDPKGFTMPEAVRDEIGIAYGIDKPILIIGEDEVSYKGFMNNYGTRLIYTKADYKSNEFLNKLLRSLGNFKESIQLKSSNSLKEFSGEYYIETFKSFIALEKEEDGLYWRSSATKRIIFTSKLQREITTRVWASVPITYPPEAQNGKVEVRVHESSRDLKITSTIVDIRPDKVDLSIKITPEPHAGDFIEFSRSFVSPWINPMFVTQEILDARPPITIDGKNFYAFDGVTPIELTKKLILHFSFPNFYKINKSDIQPFVSNHGIGINHPMPSEFDRMQINLRNYADYLIVDIEVDNPLQTCMYGIAWVPPIKG